MKKDLNILISEINSLLKEKKFEKLINEINSNFNENDKPPVILNILGAAKIFKNDSTKNDKISGANDFKLAFIKDNSFLEALINYIRISMQLDNTSEALSLAKKYQAKFGYQKDVYRGIARINFSIGNVKESVRFMEDVLEKNDGTSLNWTQYLTRLNYEYFYSQKDYLYKCKKFSATLEDFGQYEFSKFDYKKNKKVKLGFLSADFRTHPVSSLILGILELINQDKFETFGFSNTIDSQYDDETKKYKKIFNNWIDISKLKDVDALNSIRNNKIDILIHLGGLFDRNRLALIKNRIATVQVSWMNINTTGVKNMDYLIADKNLIKFNEESMYSEKIIYMPSIWNIHSGFEKKNIIKLSNKTDLNKTITFGSFNNFDKISDKVILVWSKILNKIKKSKLILRSSNQVNKDYIMSKFIKYNVQNKIEIYDKIYNQDEHLNSYKNIDLALDTFPTPGIVTTFEALWMGVPVITMEGFNLCSRAGESIMKNINMEELICKNEDEYVNKIVDLINNKEKLKEIRNKILKEVRESKLFDKKEFTKQFEVMLINTLDNHQN